MDLIEAADVSPRHRHPWEQARLWALDQLIARHIRVTPGSVVIDIGCGDAFVIGALARAFPSATFFGVDAAFTPEAAAVRQQSLPPNVRLLTALDDVPATRPAALVLLMDVIEHVPDDRAFLSGILARPFIGPESRVIVTVPAFQRLFSSHDVFLKHFRRYSNRQLRESLEHSGLQVIDIGYFFASLLVPRIAIVIKERIAPGRSHGAGLTAYSGGRIVTAAATMLLKADALALLTLRRLGISVPGLSNYAICRTSA